LENEPIMQTIYRVAIEQEEDGRFLAEVIDLPGVLAYGDTADLAAVSMSDTGGVT
jgi:predicted RNase H-like HicB family nuclease